MKVVEQYFLSEFISLSRLWSC